MADITGMPVRLTGNDEAGAFGSAVLAAVAAGIYPDISAACGSMCRDDFILFEPDREHRDDYEKLYARCRKVRRGMADLQRRQNEA